MSAARLLALVVFSLVMALFCASLAFAQAPVCKFCSSTGRLPCSEHPKEECEAEDSVIYCSVIADCAVCGGVGFVPCANCENAPAREALEKKKATIQPRKIALDASLDAKFGRALRKAESKHFVFVMELDRLKVELHDEKGRPIKKELGNHALLHLYVKRMEETYTEYLSRLRITDKEFREKLRIFIWYLDDEHRKASSIFCGQTASGGVKLMGVNPSYSVCGAKRFFKDDEQLHRNVVHCVAHLLLSAQAPIAWLGNQKAGWIDEGLAHWFEDRFFGICDNYCFQESNDNGGFRSGKYKLGVRKLLDTNELPPISEILEQNCDTLTTTMHAVSFSYVDYLLSQDPAKFNELVKRLKTKSPSRVALKEIYGLTPLEFEANWRVWVLGNYPVK